MKYFDVNNLPFRTEIINLLIEVVYSVNDISIIIYVAWKRRYWEECVMGRLIMRLKKMVGTISLIVMMLLLISCNSNSNNAEANKSGITKDIESKVYSNNNLLQLMVTANPKEITTRHSFVHDDAWSLETIEASFIASSNFKSWYEGKVVLDENGYLSIYESNSNSEIYYTYDDNNLRTTNYMKDGIVTVRLEERLEGDYIGEYYVHVETGDEICMGKYVTDSNGLVVKKIESITFGEDYYDLEYEYEDGNIKKVTKTRNGEFVSSTEVEYDTFPVKLTVYKSDDTTVIYTFVYEFDKEGNWIKCDKYEEDILIVTYERTIKY